MVYLDNVRICCINGSAREWFALLDVDDSRTSPCVLEQGLEIALVDAVPGGSCVVARSRSPLRFA